MEFLPSAPVADDVLLALPGVASVEHRGRRIVVAGEGDLTTRVLNALMKEGVGTSDIRVKTGNLEDAFVRLTQKNDKYPKREVTLK